jgi:DnaJ-class molecular chaperone
MVDPAFEIEAQAVAQILDELDYFQVLKVQQTASPSEIKAAYYRESRAYHPDRFYTLPESEVKEAIGRIYRRITEAYVCLRDDQKRKKYITDISGPERAQKLRFTEASEQEHKEEKEQEIGKTPNGRRYYKLGVQDMNAGKFGAAERNFKMALAYEPANENFKTALKQAADAQKQPAQK